MSIQITAARDPIERVIKYRFDGREFESLKQIKQHIENEIWKIIDVTPNRLRRADALAVHAAIVTHRWTLGRMLAAIDIVRRMETAEREDS